jgi:hypothetical protein
MKTFAKDANFPPVFSGIQIHVAQSLVFCVVLCGLLLQQWPKENRGKGQTTIHKALHRKLKIEQHESEFH